MAQSFCLTLDLKDDPELIAAYEAYHQKVWPEIIDAIKESGITNMTIYRIKNRLVMMIEANDSFSFEAKAKTDAQNPKVQEWEQLMWQYQQAIPGSLPGEKWQLMTPIFQL